LAQGQGRWAAIDEDISGLLMKILVVSRRRLGPRRFELDDHQLWLVIRLGLISIDQADFDHSLQVARGQGMRHLHSLVIRSMGAMGIAGLLASSVIAQTPVGKSEEDRINPPITNCNQIPDTNQPTVPTVTTPINGKLLTSGQPCQQNVSTVGLIHKDAASSGLQNLQRGFDFYSWLTFIAMNSPSDGSAIGKGPRPGGDAPTMWESLNNYRPLADVMLKDGEKPVWGTRIVPAECKPLDGPGKIVFRMGEEAFNQPFKSGPLIDQDGNFALFDILMNGPMFDYIVTKDLHSKAGQLNVHDDVVFPTGVNPGKDKDGKPTPGRMGAIMLKVSYRILDPEKNKDLLNQFHTVDALIYFPGGTATKAGPACVAKKLGLIGFHVGHKTKFAPQWVWSSFEHVSNAPDVTIARSMMYRRSRGIPIRR
jgi:hypothetical protein